MNPELADRTFRGTKYENLIVQFYMNHSHSNLDFKVIKVGNKLNIKYKDEYQYVHYLSYFRTTHEMEKTNNRNAHITFTTKELRFFYKAGISLTKDHTKRTKQVVEDWF